MRTLTSTEVKSMLDIAGRKSAYKMVGHSFINIKGVGKQCCKGCGLMALNNAATRWAIDKGCMHTDHPQHDSALKRLTRRKS